MENKIILKASNLTYWNSANQQFELEKDQIALQVGSASDQILLTKKMSVK